MSTKEKQSFALYFLLAFGLAWLCQVYGSLLLLRDGNAAVYRALLSVSMFCPLVAVLAAKRIVLHQPTGIGWKVRGKRRYWLAARCSPYWRRCSTLQCFRPGWTSPEAGW